MRKFLSVVGCSFFSPFFALAATEVIITEIDPVSEAIELYNPTSQEVVLDGWQWSEFTASGTEKLYEIEGSPVIVAGEFFVIETTRKINDSGDTVSLLSPDGEKDSIFVPEKQDTLTYQLIDDSWQWGESSIGLQNVSLDDQNEDDESDTDHLENEEQSSKNEEEAESNGQQEEEQTDDVLIAGNIIVTEMLPNPEGNDGGENEFFEVFNAESFDIDIAGWNIRDAGGGVYFFPENTVVPSGEYRAFFRSETGITLNNTSESLFLFDLSGTMVSELLFSDSAEEGFAWVRIDPLSSPEWISFATPHASTVRPTYNNSVVVSEILPNPEGTDGGHNEFLELWNNSSERLDLEGWRVYDGGGKSFIFPQDTFLEVGEYRAFFKDETGITLNNSDESITLQDPNGESVSQLSFSGSADESWAFAISDGRSFWTDTITPNLENSITGEKKSSNTNDSYGLFSSLDGGFNHSDIQLLITTVSPNTKNDFVEILCQKCDTDLAGIRLRIDDVVYQIPEGTVVQTGEYLRFVFGSDIPKEPVHIMNTWVFSLSAKNLTSTDETIALGSWDGEIFDAMCYADQNGNFISTEKKEVGQLHLLSEWSGELKEWGCVSSSALPRDTVFIRKNEQDTNTASDFIRSRSSDSTIQSIQHSVVISELFIQNDVTRITLKNIGEGSVNLQHWYLANEKKWMMNISDGDLLLYPQQEIQVQWSPQRAKKYARENMTLEIRDPFGVIHDVLCLNQSKTTKDKQDSNEVISGWMNEGLWEKQKKQHVCFEYFQTRQKHTYSRNSFVFPASVDSYTRTVTIDDAFSDPELPTATLSEKQPEDSDVQKDDPLDSFSYSVSSSHEGVMFSGSAFTGVSKVRFSIPSKNLSWDMKVKGGTFSGLIQKPFKKGRYAVDITLVFRDKTEVPLPRERFFIAQSSMPNELLHVVVAKVLPNPDGKDRGNELLVLKNISKFSGWMRGWTLEIESGETLKYQSLPGAFLHPQEDFFLQKPFLPLLKNSDVTLRIRDGWGNLVYEVAWENARSGEYFGAFAPHYISKTSKKKKKKATQGSEKISELPKSSTPKSEEKKGLIVDRNTRVLWVEVDENIIPYELPIYLPYHSHFFGVGNSVVVRYKNGTVMEVVPDLRNLSVAESSMVLGGGAAPSLSIGKTILGMILLLIGSGGLLWVFRKQRNDVLV